MIYDKDSSARLISNDEAIKLILIKVRFESSSSLVKIEARKILASSKKSSDKNCCLYDGKLLINTKRLIRSV